MAETDFTTKEAQAPESNMANDERFRKIYSPAVKSLVRELENLGNCIGTIARIRKNMEESTLEVSVEQLDTWALACIHIASFLPDELYMAAVGQKGGAA